MVMRTRDNTQLNTTSKRNQGKRETEKRKDRVGEKKGTTKKKGGQGETRETRGDKPARRGKKSQNVHKMLLVVIDTVACSVFSGFDYMPRLLSQPFAVCFRAKYNK